MTQTPLAVSDPLLRPVADKVLTGQVLSFDDGLALYQSRDLHGIGRLANFVRRKLHGATAYYNRNRHINYTNVCALSCKFCSFYRKRGEEGAYEMPVEQVIDTARKAADSGATEVHIVGGLHPWLEFDYYLSMVRGIRQACPTLHIKAFTAIEIVHFSRIARLSVREVLLALKEAGLGSMPGGGAEIFDDRVHDQVFKGKVRADRWFDVHRTAHALGIPTNATMLYGHVETPAERINHLIKLRELQAESLAAMGAEGTEARRHEGTKGEEDSPRGMGAPPMRLSPSPGTPGEGRGEGQSAIRDSTAFGSEAQARRELAEVNPQSAMEESAIGSIQNHKSRIQNGAAFNCLIPLSFIPEHSELGHLPGPTGLTDLKTLAIARLMAHNIPHLKAFWIMQGVGLSQLALNFGCDDLDGTVVWYDITKRAGHNTHQELHVHDLLRLIRETGHHPQERDTLYNPVHR